MSVIGPVGAALPNGGSYNSFVNGLVGASQILARWVIVQTGHFYPNFPGCEVNCAVAPTSNQMAVISQNGSAVGTISVSSGATLGSLSSSGTVALALGDVLEIVSGGTADATWSTLSIGLRASN